MYFIIGILLIAIGVLMLLRPDAFYGLTEGWKHKGGEPSRLYRVSARFGGVMFFLAGLCGVVFPFL